MTWPSAYWTVLPGVQLFETVSQPFISTDAGNGVGGAEDAIEATTSTAAASAPAMTPRRTTPRAVTDPRDSVSLSATSLQRRMVHPTIPRAPLSPICDQRPTAAGRSSVTFR